MSMSIKLDLTTAWRCLANAQRKARLAGLEPSTLTQRIGEAMDATELATAEWRAIQRAQDEVLEAALAEKVKA